MCECVLCLCQCMRVRVRVSCVYVCLYLVCESVSIIGNLYTPSPPSPPPPSRPHALCPFTLPCIRLTESRASKGAPAASSCFSSSFLPFADASKRALPSSSLDLPCFEDQGRSMSDRQEGGGDGKRVRFGGAGREERESASAKLILQAGR